MITPEPVNQSLSHSSPRPGAGPEGMMEQELDLRQYLAVMLNHWWVILLILLAGLAAGAAYCTLATRQYRATCRYELVQEARLSLQKMDSRTAMEMLDRELNKLVLYMEGGSLGDKVMARLESEWAAKIPESARAAKVRVSRLRKADTMVDISVDAIDADYALAYLKELLNAYQQLRRDELLETTEKALTKLREEQVSLAKDLQGAEDSLLEFKEKHNIQFTQTKAEFDEKFMANLVQRQNALRMERTMLDSQFPFLEKASAAMIQDVLSLTMQTKQATGSVGGSIVDLNADALSSPTKGGGDRVQWEEEKDWQKKEAEVLRLEAKYQDELQTYKASHPKMLELRQQIDEAKRELNLTARIAMKRLKSRYDAIKIQEKALDDSARAWRQELNLSTRERAEYENLRAKVEHLRKLYDQVYGRVLDGGIASVDTVFTRLVDSPRALEAAVWPNRLKIMALALIASLGLGVGLAFLLDYLDTSFLDVVAIEQRLGLHYLGGIPDWARSVKTFNSKVSKIVVTRDKSDVPTETYRTLRAGIEHSIGEHDHYVMLVTSGDESEGKSLTSLNLAIAQAWTGKRVLLVDGDLRRGTLHKQFKLDGKHGLADFLTGAVADSKTVMQQTSYENLTILPSGKFQHELPELLSPSRLRNLLEEWRRDFDLVVIDSAPVGRVVDTALLSRACDGVLLVVRHGKARFGDVRHCLGRLPQDKMVGFVLNGLELSNKKYGYYGNQYYAYYGSYNRQYTYGG